MKKLAILLIGLGVVALLAGFGAAVAQQAGPLSPAGGGGTLAFTYQGQLKANGQPVNDTCDFKFSVWDAANDGAQYGATEEVPAQAVEGGLFSVTLNKTGQFGPQTFTGAVRFLQTEVRCPAGAGIYTTLLPRQQMTAAPVALSLAPGAVISTTTGTQALKILNSFNGGQVLLLQNGGTDNSGTGGGDFLKGLNYPGTSTMFNVKTNGDFTQALAADGLVKAAALANCGDSPSIARYFNSVNGVVPTISSVGAGNCTINFGFSVASRFISVTAANELVPRIAIVSIDLAGNPIINRFAFNGTAASGDVYVLVY